MVIPHVRPFHVWFVKVFCVARDNLSDTVLILGSFIENQSYWIRGSKRPDFVSIHRFLSNVFFYCESDFLCSRIVPKVHVVRTFLSSSCRRRSAPLPRTSTPWCASTCSAWSSSGRWTGSQTRTWRITTGRSWHSTR